MNKISAQDVKKLREMTGAGMLSCQKALNEVDGDFEKAVDFLRSHGKQISLSRSEKNANDGAIFLNVSSDGMQGVIILLSSETDFVAKTKEFLELGQRIVKACLLESVQSVQAVLSVFVDGDTVGNHIAILSGNVGEKILLSEVKFLNGNYIIAYEHPGSRLGVLLSIEGSDFDSVSASDIAMQIAAMNPTVVAIGDVPSSFVEKETLLANEKMKEIDKPPHIIEKMIKGLVQKNLKDITLLCQPFIKNDKISVEEFFYSKMKNSKIKSFVRLSVD